MTVWFSYMCRNVFNGLESSTEFCEPLHNVAFVLWYAFIMINGVARDKSMCRHRCSRGVRGHAPS